MEVNIRRTVTKTNVELNIVVSGHQGIVVRNEKPHKNSSISEKEMFISLK